MGLSVLDRRESPDLLSFPRSRYRNGSILVDVTAPRDVKSIASSFTASANRYDISDNQLPARDFRVLGPIEVAIDGHRVDLGGAMPRKLLAILVLNRNRAVSTDRLIDALWEESPPATARKSLQKFVWSLRKVLGESLTTTDSGYLLHVEGFELDSARLERAVEKSKTNGTAFNQLLTDAISNWRGNPYPELTDTHWAAERSRLIDIRLEAEEIHIEGLISGGRSREAIARLEELAEEHPFRERLWAQLMTAFYDSGRQADALDAFQRLRSHLGKELGIEPSSELKDLEERILLQDPELLLERPISPPHNLPAPVTSFIGRTDEIAELTEALSTTRLVTLLGPAGSGKTRLATELGRNLLEDFSESGVWWVDFAPVSSPDQVSATIADCLGVGQYGANTTKDVLADYLSDRRIMLILDNCEHVVGGVAEAAETLLTASGDLTVLATSRERLGIAGEVIYDVEPLPYPSVNEPVTEEYDAVRLFIERTQSVARSDDLAMGYEEVGEIVRRLDGIPLSLELAAARVRSLGLGGLRARLDDRFSVLTSPSRGRVARHKTLEAALNWSFELLSIDEQALFTRLSVFSGGFDLDAATAVCALDTLSEDQILVLVTELADKSLVSQVPRNGRRRYSLLESLKAYGRTQVEPSEVAPLRQAHMTYFRDVAEQAAARLHGQEQQHWLDVLRIEHNNMRKALRWGFEKSVVDGVRLAIALGGYWDSMGPRTEGNSWLERAIRASETLDPALHVDALLEAASVASSVRAEISLGYAERAVGQAVEMGDEIREGRALRALSWALAVDERPVEALDAGRRALEIFERHDDAWEVALCRERLGQGGYRDPKWSVEMLERALATFRELGDRNREALALLKIADRLAHSIGDIDKALDYAKRSVEICSEIGSTHDEGHAHLEYGKVLRRAGELSSATTQLRAAVAQTKKSGDERCSIRSMTALGNTLVERGETTDGESTLRESLRRSRSFGEVHTTRSALAGLARVQIDRGDPGSATMLLGFVEELSQSLDVPVSDRASEKREAERNDLRGSVGDEFDALWEQGRAMSVEEATELALEN